MHKSAWGPVREGYIALDEIDSMGLPGEMQVSHTQQLHFHLLVSAGIAAPLFATICPHHVFLSAPLPMSLLVTPYLSLLPRSPICCTIPHLQCQTPLFTQLTSASLERGLFPPSCFLFEQSPTSSSCHSIAPSLLKLAQTT